MQLKHHRLTQIDSVDLLDSRSRERLRAHNITTVEDFLGQLYAVPDQIGELLGLDDRQVAAIRDHAEGLVDPGLLAALKSPPTRDYPLGALDPNE
jgi:hypothetical protein